jgi:hypothetical protein
MGRVRQTNVKAEAAVKYTELRAHNMAVNAQKLQSLGIPAFSTARDMQKQQRPKKQSRQSQPTRQSPRVRLLPAPSCPPSPARAVCNQR